MGVHVRLPNHAAGTPKTKQRLISRLGDLEIRPRNIHPAVFVLYAGISAFVTQVGVAQATEGPTRVLSVRQVDVEYLELSSATTCRGNQSMHAIRLLGLRHGL